MTQEKDTCSYILSKVPIFLFIHTCNWRSRDIIFLSNIMYLYNLNLGKWIGKTLDNARFVNIKSRNAHWPCMLTYIGSMNNTRMIMLKNSARSSKNFQMDNINLKIVIPIINSYKNSVSVIFFSDYKELGSMLHVKKKIFRNWFNSIVFYW